MTLAPPRKRTKRKREAPAARCVGCSAKYDLKWVGTTCVVCDGKIAAPAKEDA